MGGLYTHHGIDMGDGTIIHFSGEPTRLRHAEVRLDTLEDFAMGSPLEVISHEGVARSPEVIVATAREHLGERGYRLWQHNCEHFATYCVTGRAESAQVMIARKAGMALGLAAATTMVLGGALYHATRGRGKRGLRA
jgi:hypothetical protein